MSFFCWLSTAAKRCGGTLNGHSTSPHLCDRTLTSIGAPLRGVPAIRDVCACFCWLRHLRADIFTQLSRIQSLSPNVGTERSSPWLTALSSIGIRMRRFSHPITIVSLWIAYVFMTGLRGAYDMLQELCSCLGHTTS